MPEKFQNKYRIESTRLKGYDYGNNGKYFVTINTKNREPYFGKILNGKMQLSDVGKITRYELLKTSKVRKNVQLDEWIIMPDHIHAIIVINNRKDNPPDRLDRKDDPPDRLTGIPEKPTIKTIRREKIDGKTRRVVSTLHPNTLGSIIGQIKSLVTKGAWAMGYKDFQWQPRYHDHIIHNNGELNRIRKYIINNPKNWSRKDDPVGRLHNRKDDPPDRLDRKDDPPDRLDRKDDLPDRLHKTKNQ
ncbi:MAG: hypothetical protein JXB49_31405 [Bacteroidales bacterium]|nr:hypothetical protein [Bacteroidales bacterium]